MKYVIIILILFAFSCTSNNQEYMSLESSIDSLEVSLIATKSEAMELHSRLIQKESQVLELMDRLDEAKFSEVEYAILKDKMNLLQAQIAKVKAQLIVQQMANDSLNDNIVLLKDSVYKRYLEVEQYKASFFSLKSKIDSEKIQIVNMSVEVLRSKGGNYKETDKANKVETFKVKFTVPGNNFVQHKQYKVFINVYGAINKQEYTSNKFNLGYTGESIKIEYLIPVTKRLAKGERVIQVVIEDQALAETLIQLR